MTDAARRDLNEALEPPEVARMLRDFTLDALMLVVGVLREADAQGLDTDGETRD